MDRRQFLQSIAAAMAAAGVSVAFDADGSPVATGGPVTILLPQDAQAGDLLFAFQMVDGNVDAGYALYENASPLLYGTPIHEHAGWTLLQSNVDFSRPWTEWHQHVIAVRGIDPENPISSEGSGCVVVAQASKEGSNRG